MTMTPADAVIGSWQIEFTPNRAIRSYEIKSDGSVVDAVGSTGKLITANLPPDVGDVAQGKGRCLTQHFADWRNGSRWHLRLDQDTTGCFELITLTADGRLMVEHFNPSATELPRPDQVGVGLRVDVKRPGQNPVIGIDGPVNAVPQAHRIPLEELPPGAIDGLGDVRLRHAAPVTCVAVSPDGKWIASGSMTGEQRLWDAETGNLLRTFSDGESTKVSLAAFSPDGHSLTLFKGQLDCWKPETGEKKFLFEVEGFPIDMCYSPDGTTLAVAAKNTENVVLYDAQTGKVRERIGGHAPNAISVAYSPDGRFLASVDESGTLSLRSLQNGMTTTCPNIHGKVSFSPDAKHIAVHSGPTMSLYRMEGMDVVTPAEYSLQRGLYADTMPRTARFSSDGTRISWGNSIWDVATGKQLVEHNGMMNGPAEWFPNGEHLVASGADGVVRVIDANSGETLLPAHEPTRVFNLLSDTFSRTHENDWPRLGHLDVQLFSTSTDTLAFVRTQGTNLTVFGTHKSRLPSSGIDIENRYAYATDVGRPITDFQLAGQGSQLVVLVENRLEVWRVGGLGPLFILQEFGQYDAQQPDKAYEQLSQFAVSPDGLEVSALITKNIVIHFDEKQDRKEAGVRQIFRTWSLATGEMTLSRTGPTRRINEPRMNQFFYAHDADWHANEDGTHPKFLAAGSATLDDLDEVPNEKLFKRIEGTDGTRQFHNVRLISPDDQWMLTETYHRDRVAPELKVIDITQPEHTVLWRPEGRQFAVSHNGQWLACCTWHWDRPATIEIRHARNGVVLTTFTGHLGPVHSMSFSTDDRSIATGGGDGSTLIWDLTRFGGHIRDEVTTKDELLRTFRESTGNDSPNQYHAYWLVDPEAKTTGYRKLLITRGPLERILQTRTRVHALAETSGSMQSSPLDQQAFTFETYQDDSLWDRPFGIVESIGTLNVEKKQLVMNEHVYDIQTCPINVVLRLLENPLGTLPLHRRNHPLQGAENTAIAFALLLKDQIALQ